MYGETVCHIGCSFRQCALTLEQGTSLNLRHCLDLIFALLSVKWLFTGSCKNKENFKLLATKVLVFACERWWLIRGSKCSDLTWKPLVVWKTGRWEVVAYKRLSQPEVRVHFKTMFKVAEHSFLICVFHSPFPLKPLILWSLKMAASKLTLCCCHGNIEKYEQASKIYFVYFQKNGC